MSMTVASGQAGIFPVSAGLYPREGSRAITSQYDWTSQSRYTEDLSQLTARGIETTIQSLWLDNSTVGQFVTVTFAGTGQTVRVAPYTQATMPILPGASLFTLSIANPEASVTRVILLNVPLQGSGTWLGVAGPSLDLSFMNPGVLDPRVTFARASGGTYFNSAGVMQNAAMNLWLQSADASNAVWAKGGGGPSAAPVVTGNQIAAPDGTVSAARIDYPSTITAGSISEVAQSTTATANAYTFSVYLRGVVGGEQLYLMATPDGVTYYRTPATLTTAWQRFSLTTPTLTTALWYFQIGVDLRDGSQTGKPAQSVYAWGGQLELGSTATPYIPTTSAPNGAPRWDYNPATRALNGLLIEEARTNVALSSGDFTNATYWGAPGAGVTITVGPDLSPDGVTRMSRFSETAPDTVHYVSILVFVTTVASQMYTASCYAKAGQTRYLQMILDDATNGGFVTFDLQAGVISGALTARGTGAIGTAAIQAVGNGIYRCSLSATNPATGTRLAWVLSNSGNPGYAPDYPGNPANGLSVWGAQLEAGAFPTSYIGTLAAAVTRAQDQCSILPAGMGFYVSPGGSWAAEFIDLMPAGGSQAILPQHNNVNGAIPMYVNGTLTLAQWDGAGIQFTANALTLGAVAKGATAVGSSIGWTCLNGGPVITSSFPLGFPTLATTGVDFLRSSEGGAIQTTGYIRRVRYWPRVLSSGELQSVTT